MLIWLTWLILGNAQVDALCGADKYEPNNERARAKSTRGERVEARICGADSDWYYLRLEAGARVDVRVVAEDGRGCAAPSIYPPRARKAMGDAYQLEGYSGVRLSVVEGGKHRVHVRCDGEGVAYSLEVLREEGAPLLSAPPAPLSSSPKVAQPVGSIP